MIGRLITIAADGSITAERLGRPPSLARLHEIVGGYIEVVPWFTTFNGAPCVAFCNEEGKLNGLPMNIAAQTYWRRAMKNDPGDYLVGNIAVVVGDDQLLGAL